MSKDASGQIDPKKTNGGKRVKRGRLHFTEEEVTRQAGGTGFGPSWPEVPEHREIQAGRRTGKAVLPLAAGGRGPGRYRL